VLSCLTSQRHVQPSTRLQLQQAQNFKPSAGLGIRARHQTDQTDGCTPTTSKTYVAADYIWGSPETVAQERMTWAQEPSHPTTRHMTQLVPPPGDPMLDMDSPLNNDRNSGMNAGYGSTADVNALPQRLTTMHWNIYANSSNFWQQQEAIPPERTQVPIASEYLSGAKGTAHLVTLGMSGDTNGDSRLVTFHWQPAHGKWAQAQVLVTDQIRNSYVQYIPS
jgi:hypothetical protein